MKILIISPLPPPIGGIAMWTTNILDYYREKQEVQLIHLNSSVKNRNITRLDHYSRIQSGFKDSTHIFKNLFSIVKKENPDIIHITSSASLGLIRDFLVIVIAKLYNIPVVTHFHFGQIPQLKRVNNYEWRLLKKIASLSAAVLVLDMKSKDTLVSAGVLNVYVTPNPISRSIETSITNKLYSTDANNTERVKGRVIFVGHIVKNKGVFELVKACLLTKNVEQLRLIGPYENDIKNKLSALNRNKQIELIFTGVLSKESVLHEMKNASLLALPSYTEGFPNVIIEAMAMGCPIVSTDVGAISDILDIDSKNPAGDVVKPKDIQALSKSMSKIIMDHELAKTYTKNALNKVMNNYTLDKVCKLYDSIWKSVIHN